MSNDPRVQHLADLPLDLVFLQGRVAVGASIGRNRPFHQCDGVVVLTVRRQSLGRGEDIGVLVEEVGEWGLAR